MPKCYKVENRVDYKCFFMFAKQSVLFAENGQKAAYILSSLHFVQNGDGQHLQINKRLIVHLDEEIQSALCTLKIRICECIVGNNPAAKPDVCRKIIRKAKKARKDIT